LDGIADGLPYRVDPVPLTAVAELRALLAGRLAWKLIGASLTWRTPESIRADTRRGRPIVFADHRCDTAPEPADVDPTYLPVIRRLLSAAPIDTRWSESETTVLVLLGQHLGARVVAESNKPPY
jgi:hypothetical protein